MIGIDPGHGGQDNGCVANGLIEAHWTGHNATRVLERLKQRGIDARLTRGLDEGKGLLARGWSTRDCAAVVSIHVNAHAQEAVNGFETYHWPGSSAGIALATQIAMRAPKRLLPTIARRPPATAPYTAPAGRIISADDDPATTSDDWLQRPRAVLRWHRPPAILVEVGYATNPDDVDYLLTLTGQEAVAEAIAGGVEAWLAARRPLAL